MSSQERLSRRGFLRWSAVGASAALLASCAPQVVKETVVVEKEVEKEVTTVVEKEVEKEVTVVVEAPGAKTAEEILIEAGNMPGSPDHPKGWKTLLPDLPAGVPYQDPVVISATRRVDAQTRFCEGDDLENNPWAEMIASLFNVRFSVAWTWSTGDEANQKYNLAMASGDMPDFLETVPPAIFSKMVEADLLEDITDAYDAYASPRWKAIWREYGDLPWTWVTFNGRKYGLSRVEDLAHNDCLMWYRQDWLEKTGKSVPTTFEEVHDLALAFVEGDFGQGASGSTIGLLASAAESANLFATWYGSLDFFWGGFGYIPHQWQPEGDGLMYGAIRPEVKEALGVLAQWYQDGVLAKDFYTYGTSQAMQNVAANLCGFHFTPSWGANLDSVVNDPEAVWAFADVPVGPKGFARRFTENNFKPDPFAWRKGFEHLDKIFSITDWWDQLWHDPWRRMHGWEDCNYQFEGDTVKSTGISFQNWTPGPVGTRGSGFLDPKQPATQIRYQLDEWGKLPPEQRDAMMNLVLEDPTGTTTTNNLCRLRILETADQGVMTQLQRTATPTEIERGADMEKLRNQAFINIIIGQQPLDDWDTFVEQWKAVGGDQWTQEVNEWWQSR